MQIVVARYNEDLSWLTKYKDACLIYNKGDSIDMPNVALPNIGRESHTYLHHIIEKYNELDDVTVFTQANPFDHCPNFIHYIELMLEHGLNQPFVNLSSWVLKIDELNCTCWPYHRWDNLLPEVVEFIFGEIFYKQIWFGAGAIFAVRKEAIQQRSLEFYQNAITLFPQTADCQGYGHAFERLWPTIFNAS
jgi:hypothetical protein